VKANSGSSAKVAKRDGSTELFQIGKLRRSLAAAMRTCNYDARYAEALARAIAVHVKDWDDARPPTTEYVFRCVRAVLSETGLDDVAREIVRHRRTRALQRRRLAVVDPNRSGRPPRSWSKATVVQTLVRRFEMRAESARILAGEIEQRALALNYSVLSTSLIAELIRNEMMAWGLSDGVATESTTAGGEDVAAGHEAGKEN
jgi:hypothetical protein